MMINKLLIIIPSFNNGGTISSLKNILPTLKQKIPNIDIFAITNTGVNMEYCSKYANILGIDGKKNNNASIKSKIAKLVKRIKKTLSLIGIDISSYVFRHVSKRLEKNHYDLIIAFQEGLATHLASYFKGARKIAWVHCDYSNYLKLLNSRPEFKMYKKFEKVVCVSQYTMEQFRNNLPEINTLFLYNIISTENIINKSTDNYNNICYDTKKFTILSVGRLDSVKRFETIPYIIYQLKQKGINNFTWYIIGGGNAQIRQKIEKEIIRYQISELILLGEINNPYPYFRNADLFVSTSISEACPYVINEAKILHIPIVSTNFGSVYEFIEDGVNGLISPIETISEKIASMILDKELYSKIKNNISEFEYDNNIITDKLFNEILEI